MVKRRKQFQTMPEWAPPELNGGDGFADPLADVLPDFGQSYEKPDDQPFRVRRNREAFVPPLTPEQESGLLDSAVGAVQYLGESIEKPGYAVRGLAVGQSNAALNLIPFYDALQGSRVGQALDLPEAPKVSGWDFAEHFGAPANEPGFDRHDPWKWGLEVATNPLSFWTTLPKVGTAATKAAKLAVGAEEAATKGLTAGSKAWNAARAGSMAGQDAQTINAARTAATDILAGARPATTAVKSTPAEIAAQIREGSRAVGGFGLPFMDPWVTFGRGSTKAANLVEAIGYSPPVAAMRGMFSHVPNVGGVIDPRLQRQADIAFAETQRIAATTADAQIAFARQLAPLRDAYMEAAESLGKSGDDLGYNEVMRLAKTIPDKLGGAPEGGELATMMGQQLGMLPGQAFPSAINDVAQSGRHYTDIIAAMQNAEDDVWTVARNLGQNVGKVGNATERYTPRGSLHIAAGEDKLNPIRHRQAWIEDLPRSTKVANAAARDKGLKGFMAGADGNALKDADGRFVHLAPVDHLKGIVDELGGMGIQVPPEIVAPHPTIGQMAALGPAQAQAKVIDQAVANAQALLMRHKYIEPELVFSAQKGLITAEEQAQWIDDLFMPQEITKTVKGKPKTITKPPKIARVVRGLNRMKEESINTGIWTQAAVEDHASYMKSMIERVHDLRTARNFLKTKGVIEPVAKATKPGVSLADEWGTLNLSSKALPQFLAEAKLPGKAADYQVTADAARVLTTMQELRKPQTVTEFGRIFDKITGVFKTYWTVPRPAFHARNSVSGVVQALAEGLVTPSELFKSWWSAAYRTAGRKGKGALSGLEQEFMSLHGFQGVGSHIAEELKVTDLPSGPLGGTFKTIFDAVLSPIQTAKTKGWSAVNPFAVSQESPNLLAEAGQRAYAMVEYMNRFPYYAALRKKGFSPSAAMHHVVKTQFDYSLRSPLERRVLARTVPFFGWVRSNLPLQIKRLIERPLGGPTGMMVKGMGDIAQNRGENTFVPAWLKEGVGIPLGGPPDASMFIKASGLPIEDLNKFVIGKSFGAGVKRTAQKFASSLHPLIVGPVEGMTGTQLYTGRPMRDLQTYQTSSEAMNKALANPMLNSLLHYSPAASMAGDAFQWADPRKGYGQKAANFLTGIKTGTYDAELAKLSELRRASEQQAAKNPMVGLGSYAYIRPQYKGKPGTEGAARDIQVTQQLSKKIKQIMQRREAMGKRTE